MNIKVLSTGSQGNCYLLECNNQILILDCGIPVKNIKVCLDFDLSKVVGCVVTHSHTDHNKSVSDLEKMGIKVFKPYESDCDSLESVRYGNFVITPFNLPHNGTRNFGFLLRMGQKRALYLTDFEYCPYIFAKLKPNHIFIECNYQQDLVSRDLPNYEHKIRGHCSLDTCKKFIETNATDSLESVLLLHMGAETCNPTECVNEIKKVSKSAWVDFARMGDGYNLDKLECPF